MATDTLDKYLQTEQAREDVRLVVAKPDDVLRYAGNDGPWLERTRLKAWTRLGIEGVDRYITAYYCPDGDRYIVTDLGEGVRALRLRTGDLYRRSGGPEECRAIRGVWFGDALGATNVTAADLPDALCRVMLASLRVAQS